MNRVTISRWVNHWILRGDPNEMVSSRVYAEDRYGWVLCIDWWFYTIRGERRHCLSSYVWEKRNGKKKTQTIFQKERKREMNDEWEKSHLPLDEGGIPPDEVRCDYCPNWGSLTLDMIEVRRYTNSEPINLRFCSENCHQDYYMSKVRKEEGHVQCNCRKCNPLFDW